MLPTELLGLPSGCFVLFLFALLLLTGSLFTPLAQFFTSPLIQWQVIRARLMAVSLVVSSLSGEFLLLKNESNSLLLLAESDSLSLGFIPTEIGFINATLFSQVCLELGERGLFTPHFFLEFSLLFSGTGELSLMLKLKSQILRSDEFLLQFGLFGQPFLFHSGQGETLLLQALGGQLLFSLEFPLLDTKPDFLPVFF
ncbi:hypothetical protein [Roseibacillus persicicus]|uniref:hypothetical protein n=1 Tax=Roseibacillus persicicus TaxID=454148 RepID=UPI00280D1ABD|nr:hypothetical protein [Roseibacillus persicicus]MDQ8190439.1 hypothetical protein [Roseibacillus persicicus]